MKITKITKIISSFICIFLSFSSLTQQEDVDLIEIYNSVKNTDRLHELGHTTPFRKEHPETVLFLSRHGGVSTGFFVEQRVLVTAFHLLEVKRCEGERLPFAFQDMDTLELVPVKNILALDPKHDLALLEPADGWYSKHFYSLDVVRDQPSSLIGFFGFPAVHFRVFIGRINDEQSSAPFIRAWVPPQPVERFTGYSGSPVLFKNDDVLAGMLSQVIPGSTEPNILFTSREKIKELMSKERLSCTSYTCITEALENLEFEAENKGDAETYFAMGALHSMGIRFPNDRNLPIFWFRKAAELGHGHAQSNLNTLLERMNEGH